MRELLTNAHFAKGLYYFSEVDRTFEKMYLQVRKKEGRVYADKELMLLPEQAIRHTQEWPLRQESADHLINYLQVNPKPVILEIGCGNGWLANRVCNNTSADVYALDLNEPELKQAVRVFAHERLKLIYGNIFSESFDDFRAGIDLIYLAGSIQYFNDLSLILNRLFSFLNPSGEIHILDTPFYANVTQSAAKQRSKVYYEQLGFPEMISSYHHHTWEALASFAPEVLYKPSLWQKLLRKRKSPFPWIKLTSKQI
ncbi:hypothetical protein BKI52_39570 [marine bacterium AO1-C]|nr:hypothetical protein BKI52_39570 [marine bacterium AO1-C]